MAEKFTQGEWKYHEELRANLSMIAGDNYVVCGLPNPIPSGDAEQDKKELAMLRVNARLIAQAPAMYEALKALMGLIGDADLPDNGELSGGAICDMARTVLAKIEGKG